MCGNRIRDVRVVVAIAGRSLNDDGFRDSGPLLLRNELLDVNRTLLRPVGLMSAKRRTRISPGIGRDDVRMGIDDRKVHEAQSEF